MVNSTLCLDRRAAGLSLKDWATVGEVETAMAGFVFKDPPSDKGHTLLGQVSDSLDLDLWEMYGCIFQAKGHPGVREHSLVFGQIG